MLSTYVTAKRPTDITKNKKKNKKKIRGATALTSLGRLSSRRWQSFQLHHTVLG
jgi:hypothetical protein